VKLSYFSANALVLLRDGTVLSEVPLNGLSFKNKCTGNRIYTSLRYDLYLLDFFKSLYMPWRRLGGEGL
jgi:hypothetical protein